jgi:hypothetical protein
MIFERITVRPDVCGGKPSIRGLRFPVSRLLGLLASGETEESILICRLFVAESAQAPPRHPAIVRSGRRYHNHT